MIRPVNFYPPEEAAKRVRESSIGVELAAALQDWSLLALQEDPGSPVAQMHLIVQVIGHQALTSGIAAQGSLAARMGSVASILDAVAYTERWKLLELARAPVPVKAQWQTLLKVAQAADPDPLRIKVREALEQGRIQPVKDLLASLKVEDLPPPTLMAFAKALSAARAHDEAAQLLQQGQLQYPAEFWINIELANALRQKESPDYEKAIRFYSVALALRPESAPIRNYLASTLSETGQVDEAIAQYRELIRSRPDFAWAHYNQPFQHESCWSKPLSSRAVE
jgi:tetratricopeptide (TPR) repeat protein